MFGLFGSGQGVGAAELLTATIVPVGGGSPLFDFEWTKDGNTSAYKIYLAVRLTGGGAYSTVYSNINPDLLTYAGDVSTFPGYTPGDNPNAFDFEVGLVAVGPTQAANSPIFLSPPY